MPSSRHPDEFKVQGLRNLPAIIHGNRVAIDTVEEIVDYIDSQFPGILAIFKIPYFEHGSLERLYLKRGPFDVYLRQSTLQFKSSILVIFYLTSSQEAFRNCRSRRYFTSSWRGIGISFQLAITPTLYSIIV